MIWMCLKRLKIAVYTFSFLMLDIVILSVAFWMQQFGYISGPWIMKFVDQAQNLKHSTSCFEWQILKGKKMNNSENKAFGSNFGF